MKLVPRALLDELTAKAALSPRARAHHNIHASAADLVQRFLVVAQRDSYFRPHRHTNRAELAVLLRGEVDVLTFDAHGAVTARLRVGATSEALAYETPPGTWHTPSMIQTGRYERKEGRCGFHRGFALAPALIPDRLPSPTVAGYSKLSRGVRPRV